MNKLDKVFRINPLYESDGYKMGHNAMLAPDTVREYWTWIPRSLKYMHPSIKKIMSSHQQMVWRYIHSNFKELFFDQPVECAEKFGKDMALYLMQPYEAGHFSDLHKLGYLPVHIQSLPEGIFTEPNIPHMTGINTVDGYSWLGLYLETLVSKLAWQGPTAATIGAKFKKNAVEWVTKTDPENLWFADFMCHDFHSRGGNPFTSIAVGLGHAFSNKGSDTLNVIPASRYYYDFDENNVPIYSVNASEHSVTCTQLFYYEDRLRKGLENEVIKKYYSFDLPYEGSIENPDYLAIAEYMNLGDWIKRFPNGILSYVGDTMNLWKVITHVASRLKKEILGRDGKLVFRPDSGDPETILCGVGATEEYNGWDYEEYLNEYDSKKIHRVCESEFKGVINLLAEIFGTEETSTGYLRLNSHIGAIYGDSINLERQVAIYSNLASQGYAATVVVLGIGSFSYVYMTRDQAGYAAKGAWFEIEQERTDINPKNDPNFEGFHNPKEKIGFNIYKDPITDDGTKKSLKGFQFVNDKYEVEGEVSEEKAFSEENMLKTIYKNGKFFNQTTLEEIRERLNN